MSLDAATLGFIFAAGTSALFSPCGFPMLPGYVSYYLGSEMPLEKAALGGLTCALGILTVFGLVGTSAALLGNFIQAYVTWLELAAGAAILLMGIIILTQANLPAFFTKLKAPKQRGFIGIYFYGIVYGLATLGCSGPIFLAVLFWALSQGIIGAIVDFSVFAAGMGIPLIITTILVAKAKKAALNRLTNATLTLQRLSGIVLIVIGIYLISYYASFVL